MTYTGLLRIDALQYRRSRQVLLCDGGFGKAGNVFGAGGGNPKDPGEKRLMRVDRAGAAKYREGGRSVFNSMIAHPSPLASLSVGREHKDGREGIRRRPRKGNVDPRGSLGNLQRVLRLVCQQEGARHMPRNRLQVELILRP